MIYIPNNPIFDGFSLKSVEKAILFVLKKERLCFS